MHSFTVLETLCCSSDARCAVIYYYLMCIICFYTPGVCYQFLQGELKLIATAPVEYETNKVYAHGKCERREIEEIDAARRVLWILI